MHVKNKRYFKENEIKLSIKNVKKVGAKWLYKYLKVDLWPNLQTDIIKYIKINAFFIM